MRVGAGAGCAVPDGAVRAPLPALALPPGPPGRRHGPPWGPPGRDLLWDRIQYFGELHRSDGASRAEECVFDEPCLDDPLPGTVCIVFDGNEPAAEQKSANPWVVFAQSADQWIVKQVRESRDPSVLAVVSADRQLTGRCRHAGARIVAPRDFVALCPSGEG